jgi:hypothetical protein
MPGYLEKSACRAGLLIYAAIAPSDKPIAVPEGEGNLETAIHLA